MPEITAELMFWQEVISEAASECGVTLTAEQLECFAKSAEMAHENYGLSFYEPESPYPGEIKRLEAEVKREREKIHCRICNGTGTTVTYGGTMMGTSRCWKCHGEGRYDK